MKDSQKIPLPSNQLPLPKLASDDEHSDHREDWVDMDKIKKLEAVKADMQNRQKLTNVKNAMGLMSILKRPRDKWTIGGKS